MRSRLLISIAALAAALAIAGCGGSGDSGSDPASVAPPGTPFYIEAAVHPDGDLSANVNSLAQTLVGVDDVGELIVSELEQQASDSGEDLDFAREVEPWLGDRAGIFFENYDGEDFTSYGIAVQSTDTDATQEFIDDHGDSPEGPAKEGSFEGVDFRVQRDSGVAVGIVDDMLLFAEDEATFKAAVEASEGESLADEASFSSAMDAASSESLADVFVDIGGLIEQAGSGIDPEAKLFFEATGIEAEQATAVASLIPGSDRVEVDISTDLTGENPQSGDASKLLGELPGGSLAAFSSAGFGKRIEETIDRIDAKGIPGSLEPGELKSSLKAAGIEIGKIVSSLGDLGVFAEGNTRQNLTGAVVIETKEAKDATDAVGNLGLLLRAAGVKGLTAIGGQASGFSIRNADLGSQPLVIAAKADRIAISYGLAASALALSAGSGATLAENPAYKEAVASLGDTPISGFVAGPAALQLADALIPADKRDTFEELKPYLSKIAYAAIGTGVSGDRTTAKVIVSLGK